MTNVLDQRRECNSRSLIIHYPAFRVEYWWEGFEAPPWIANLYAACIERGGFIAGEDLQFNVHLLHEKSGTEGNA